MITTTLPDTAGLRAHRMLNTFPEVTSIAFSTLAVAFAAWYLVERTLSIHTTLAA